MLPGGVIPRCPARASPGCELHTGVWRPQWNAGPGQGPEAVEPVQEDVRPRVTILSAAGSKGARTVVPEFSESGQQSADCPRPGERPIHRAGSWACGWSMLGRHTSQYRHSLESSMCCPGESETSHGPRTQHEGGAEGRCGAATLGSPCTQEKAHFPWFTPGPSPSRLQRHGLVESRVGHSGHCCLPR